ncbi:MAG: lyase family protein, partial [Betaproteobacteria bacterium]
VQALGHHPAQGRGLRPPGRTVPHGAGQLQHHSGLGALAQPDLGELQESQAEGRGGSSAMPHKRNPVGAMVALSALHRAPHRVAAVLGAMAVTQERGLGSWQAEGAELAELLSMAAASATAMAQALAHASADPARMAALLQAHGGDAAFNAAQAPAATGLQAERAALWAELEHSLREDQG